MKKLFILIFFSLAVCLSVNAQLPLAELDKVKEIKLLESNRADVKRILVGYTLETTSSKWHYQDFSTENAEIKIEYSSGKCSDDEQEWNVSEWIVTRVMVSPNESFSLGNLTIDYTDFKKEQFYQNRSESIYYNKDSGIGFEVEHGEVKAIYLFPLKDSYDLLCDNEELRERYASDKWFSGETVEDGIQIREPRNEFPDVEEIAVSKEVIIICPSSDSNPKIKCDALSQQIKVFTNAVDPELDPLTYKYEVSGGKIIGQGANVIWDLSGVAAGVYAITASVDDGCGFCGKPKTKTITVKNCEDCLLPK